MYCCCLGVACEVMIKNGAEITKEVKSQGHCYYNTKWEILSVAMVKDLGLRGTAGELLEEYKDYNSLAEMNDHNFTHKQIADYIEKHPENVFVSPKTG